jgi:uncharacterized protein (DUF2236 family)
MDGTGEFIVRGPETVTWRVVLDPLMVIAGVRALMLQALHPMVMKGVWQNSDFMRDPFGRLFRTANFVAVTALGTPSQASALGARIRGIHRQLRITDGERRHRVDEPSYLLWVHCAEVASYLEVIRRGGLRLTSAEADAYYDEQRTTATFVGLHASDVPGTAAEMASYFGAVRDELVVTSEARATVRFLLRPKLPHRFRRLRPFVFLWFPLGAIAYYSLPAWARQMYRALPEPPGVQPAATLALRMFRTLFPLIPRRIRSRPFSVETKDLIADLDRRLRSHGITPARNLSRTRLP